MFLEVFVCAGIARQNGASNTIATVLGCLALEIGPKSIFGSWGHYSLGLGALFTRLRVSHLSGHLSPKNAPSGELEVEVE